MLSSIAISLLFSALAQAKLNHSTSGTHHSFSIPSTAPDSSIAVPADFFGFGFETAFLPNFDNGLSENLVNAVGSRMSKPLIIRIGGTGGDLVKVDMSQKNATKCVGGPGCPLSSKDEFVLGRDYFKVFERFQNASMTIQAPMKNSPMNETMAYVRNAWNALGSERVAGIALGNEPNFYSYGVKEYIKRALDVEKNITTAFNLKGDEAKIFELGDISNNGAIKGRPYDLTDVLADGLNKNGLGKWAAEHYYQIYKKLDHWNGKNMQQYLMNHTAILDRLEVYEKAIKSSQEHGKDLAFTISEVGSVLGGAPIDFSGSFGAALWAVDFHLAAMTKGVKRIANTQRPVATHAFWVPDSSAPKTKRPLVQGIFPSAPFIADFVGKDESLGKVVEIDTKAHNPDLFSAYAMYGVQSEKIDRVALVNLKQWDQSSNSKRGDATVTLDVGDNVKSASVRRLHANKGSSAVGFDWGGAQNNVTYAGEQWTFAIDEGKGHFLNGHKEEESVDVKGGKVTVGVPDTEAVIVYFE